MGGPKALETIAAAVKGSDEQLQDTGSRVLGEWMSVDAAPVLLDLAKTASSDKYQVRALRGYIRLARQFAMPDQQRAEMCQKALDAASRAEEQKLVLAVLERYPSVDTLRVAVKAAAAARAQGRRHARRDDYRSKDWRENERRAAASGRDRLESRESRDPQGRIWRWR